MHSGLEEYFIDTHPAYRDDARTDALRLWLQYLVPWQIQSPKK